MQSGRVLAAKLTNPPWKNLLRKYAGWLAVVALAALLRFYQLGADGYGNLYYAATVKSMLVSWPNFFFAAFEPLGSVTVDKPPLGFWVEALSALVFGMNGFALALPNALAGTLSVALLMGLVKKPFGSLAGLAAGLALAVMPVAVVTERNNTIDGLLVFSLLLAVWAVWHAVQTGRLWALLLGFGLVGLGFNIKMLQAYLVLPGLVLFYLLGSAAAWWRRLLYLGLATLLLLVVSLSWAWVVDAIPPQNRPYIGSSPNNSVVELILGHNGVARLQTGIGSSWLLRLFRANPPRPQNSPGSSPPMGPALVSPNPAGQSQPPAQGQNPPGQPVQNPGAGQAAGNFPEVGEPGVLRLFREPLVVQAGWLLPLALASLVLAAAAAGLAWPLSPQHQALLLWAGWLLPECLYFSFTSGIFHAYYLIMAAPPLAALVGAGFWGLEQILRRSSRLGWALAMLLTGLTLAFELFILKAYPLYAWIGALPMLGLWLAGLAHLAFPARVPAQAGLALLLASLLAAPLLWSGVNVFSASGGAVTRRIGPLSGVFLSFMANNSNPSGPPNSQPQGQPGPVNPPSQLRQPGEVLNPLGLDVNELLANTSPGGYLFAAARAQEAAPYILSTGRPVLSFGGFSGGDNIVSPERLARLVADGQLRYVWVDSQLGQTKPQLGSWVTRSCRPVQRSAAGTNANNQPGQLYDCAGQK